MQLLLPFGDIELRQLRRAAGAGTEAGGRAAVLRGLPSGAAS